MLTEKEFKIKLKEWDELLWSKIQSEDSTSMGYFNGGRGQWLRLLVKAAKGYNIHCEKKGEYVSVDGSSKQQLDNDIQSFMKRRIKFTEDTINRRNSGLFMSGGAIHDNYGYETIINEYTMIRDGLLDKFLCYDKNPALVRNATLENAIDEMKLYHPLYILSDRLDESVLKMYEYALFEDKSAVEAWNKMEELLDDSTKSNKLKTATKEYYILMRAVFCAVPKDFDDHANKMWEFYKKANNIE